MVSCGYHKLYSVRVDLNYNLLGLFTTQSNLLQITLLAKRELDGNNNLRRHA